MIEHYDYIVEHWSEYKLTDTKQEFIELINCLEAMGESIDSLHSAVLNGDYFGDIFYNEWKNDRELVESVFYFCEFMTVEDLKGFLYSELEDCEGDEEFFYELYFLDKGDAEIKRTTDGYVMRVWV